MGKNTFFCINSRSSPGAALILVFFSDFYVCMYSNRHAHLPHAPLVDASPPTIPALPVAPPLPKERGPRHPYPKLALRGPSLYQHFDHRRPPLPIAQSGALPTAERSLLRVMCVRCAHWQCVLSPRCHAFSLVSGQCRVPTPHPDGQSGARGLPTAASASTCAPHRQRVRAPHE